MTIARKKALSCFAVTALMLGAVQSFAQTQPARPMPPDPYDPRPSGAQQAQPAVQYPASNDFPSAEVQAIPPAHARVVDLRWTREQSRRDLNDVVDRLRDDFERSSEHQAAVRTQQVAHDRFVSARESALNTVRSDSRYAALKKLASELQRRIQLMQEQEPKADPQVIRGMADLRLEYNTKATAMEADALAADSGYIEARQKLLDAAIRVRQLRQDFERSLRRNTEFVSARTVYNQLGVAYLTADAYYQSALDARDIALRYAYWLHRWDQYQYSTAYPYYGGYYPYVQQTGYHQYRPYSSSSWYR